MTYFPASLERLIDGFAALPGIGRKSAQRLAFHIINMPEDQVDDLRELISATGCSYSKPVLDDEGEVDMVASRRVEFLFRLTDEEMVREMMEILSWRILYLLQK